MNQAVRLASAAIDPSRPKWVRWVAVIGVLYIISPIDVLPDVIPVIGWIDDILVLLGIVRALLASFKRPQAAGAPPVIGP